MSRISEAAHRRTDNLLSERICFNTHKYNNKNSGSVQDIQKTTKPEGEKREKFNAGKFIIDHVTDKYEWHLWGSHENPTSIPLPIIVYSKSKGLDIFLSSKLDEGKVYNGYKFEVKTEGEK